MRYAAIDVLRTLAIILMVIVHFLENLAGVTWAPAGFGAPMFGFLAGVSYRISILSQIAKGRSDAEISRSTLRRGLIICLIGFLFNVLVWLPADTFNWDVLTLIGSAILLLGLIRDLPTPVPLLLAAIVFALSPLLRIESSYDEYWLNSYYDPDWTFPQLALGYLVNGYFPLFPWLIFPLAGYMAGRQALPDPSHPDDSGQLGWDRLRPLIVIGVGCLVVQAGLYFTRSYQTTSPWSDLLRGWTMFPASVEYVIGMLGWVLVAFSLSLWWIDAKQGLARLGWFLSFARTMSQYSLSIYIFHHLIHIWPLWVYALLTGQETIHYWRIACSWQVAMGLILPGVAVCYLVFRFMELRRWGSLEGVIRRFCD